MAGITEALRRFGGMYGSAWRDQVQLAEAVEVTGAVEVNRIEVPLVGQTKTGYKPGRETREGTLNVQKIDAKWELEMFRFLNASLAARRAARPNGVLPLTSLANATLRTFDLKIEVDDPEAGYEAWQLENCQIWRMPLGFSITDDIINREFPFTWESERPLSAFTYNAQGQAVPYVPS